MIEYDLRYNSLDARRAKTTKSFILYCKERNYDLNVMDDLLLLYYNFYKHNVHLVQSSKAKARYLHKPKVNMNSKETKRKYKWTQYINRCESYDRDITISFEIFNNILDKNCYYCGQEAQSIDRIDSKKGYIEGNCLPSCTKCNVMKMAGNYTDFLSQIDKIYKYQHQNEF